MGMLRCVVFGCCAFAVACGGDDAPACRVNADCASGTCNPSGRCEIVGDRDADLVGSDAGSLGPDGAQDAAGSMDRDGSVAPTDGGAPVVCAPNRDGIIERTEVPLGPGLRATFRVASDVELATFGTPRGDGTFEWDLSGALEGDRDVLVETLPLDGRWFSGDYVGASYAVPLRDSDPALGVFQLGETALALRGVVEGEATSLTRTKVSYSPAATVLAFPVAVGTPWSSASTVGGLFRGVLSTWTEDWAATPDARGELRTPFGRFDVVRVRVVLRRTIGLLTATVRSQLFVSECFGTVATITSTDNEPSDDFTRAAEVRRLAP